MLNAFQLFVIFGYLLFTLAYFAVPFHVLRRYCCLHVSGGKLWPSIVRGD